ncbi:MAG TPA: IS1380 family transposase [candidate division Zixibacteria bacterium]|nr:IS1380 family transposase [candidate division Zixibacteria bacterium]
MATDCIAQTTFRFQRIRQAVVARFDQPEASSDGGAILLKRVDEALGLTARLAAALPDPRQPGKVQHSIRDLLRQRVFGLACGYPDGNDAARLAHDPLHKLLLDRDPVAGVPLGSQPTLSRFENAVSRPSLYRLGVALADTVLQFHRTRLGGRVRRITIDVDTTDDPTHGQQQFAFFNGYYDTWCYLPLIATVTFNDEPAQYLVATLLRPGTAASTRGVRGLLRRLCSRLRATFPGARLRVRLDAGFASAPLLTFLEREAVEYVVAWPAHARLRRRIRRLQARARALARQRGRSVRLLAATGYRGPRWPHPRRLILKAEVLYYPGRAPKDNPRFVLTNLPHHPATVYAIYCARGDMENRLKELQHGLASDRTSCSRFGANQLRLLFAAAAYVLFQVLRAHAQGTPWAGAQVATLRERLIKVAAWIHRSVRRIVLHLPRSCAWREPWRQLAAALGAT